jgi:hypothetical protein
MSDLDLDKLAAVDRLRISIEGFLADRRLEINFDEKKSWKTDQPPAEVVQKYASQVVVMQELLEYVYGEDFSAWALSHLDEWIYEPGVVK